MCCTLRRSSRSQMLNTAQKSAGCASVRPRSSEYANVIGGVGHRLHSVDATPPIVVVRRYALYSDIRSLNTVIVGRNRIPEYSGCRSVAPK